MSLTASSTSLFKFLAVAACLSLSGCGFHAVYAKTENSENTAVQLASIKVEDVEGHIEQIKRTDTENTSKHEEQVLRTNLEALLNPGGMAANPAYSIKIKLRLDRRDLGIRGDLRVTRFDVLAEADYKLIEIATRREVDSGTVKTKSSFNRTTSEFSTYVAEENSNELAARELAQLIKERMIYYFDK